MILLFGFFFGAVSARIVGIVGSSNTPVSGMTIAAMLMTTLILKAIGVDGTAGMISAISVGAVVCITMAIAGDTSQDLKTGFLLGATPKKQQIGEIIGVTASAVVIGGVLILLNSAWGFGSKEMSAGALDTIDKLAHAIKNLDKIIEHEDYSGDYMPMRDRSYARRRDAMGRYSSRYDR